MKACAGYLWLLLFLTGMVQAHDNNQVAVYTNSTPVLSEVDDQGNVTGFAVEVARQIILQAGLEPDVQVQPFARVLRNAQTRHWSVAPGLARTPARESDFHWITPILANQVTLYIRNDQPLNIESVESVAIQRHDFRDSIARDMGVKNIVGLSSWSKALEAVVKKRVDGMLFSPSGFKLLCNEFPEDCKQVRALNTQRFFYNYLVLGKMPGNEVLADKLRIAAEVYKETDEYTELMKKTVQTYATRGFEATVQNKILTLAKKAEARTPPPDDQELWVLAEETPFFMQSDSAGNVTGYGAHLVNAILKTAGVSTPILITPWPRIMREMQVKPNILTFALGRTPEREKAFYWITPVTRTRHGLFGEQDVFYNALSDVPGDAVIGGLKGDYRVNAARREGLKVIEYLSWDKALKAVREEQIDFLYTSLPALHIHCNAGDALCKKLKPVTPMEPITLYLAMSKKHTMPYLAERLRQAAMQVKDSSAYHHWVRQWSDRMNAQRHLPVHVDGGVINLWAQD